MGTKLPRKLDWILRREQLAWAAGFVDGEGSFYLMHTRSAKRPNKLRRPRFEIGQVDRQALEQLRDALPFGARITGPYNNRKDNASNASDIYTYYVSGFEDVQALLALLWTWLGPVKRKQAMSILYQGV